MDPYSICFSAVSTRGFLWCPWYHCFLPLWKQMWTTIFHQGLEKVSARARKLHFSTQRSELFIFSKPVSIELPNTAQTGGEAFVKTWGNDSQVTPCFTSSYSSSPAVIKQDVPSSILFSLWLRKARGSSPSFRRPIAQKPTISIGCHQPKAIPIYISGKYVWATKHRR